MHCEVAWVSDTSNLMVFHRRAEQFGDAQISRRLVCIEVLQSEKMLKRADHRQRRIRRQVQDDRVESGR